MMTVRLFFALILVCLPTIAAGCANFKSYWDVDCCAEIPAGYIPEPAGNKICQWQTAQVANAETDRRVLYRSNFVGNTARLSPAAIARVHREANSGAGVFPWIVEPSGNIVLDNARLKEVAGLLAELEIVPDVMLATPAALGLSGPQAERAASALGRSSTQNSAVSGAAGLGSGQIGGRLR